MTAEPTAEDGPAPLVELSGLEVHFPIYGSSSTSSGAARAVSSGPSTAST